jgi:hypothetical protein
VLLSFQGLITEGSHEDHPEDLVHGKFKGEPEAEDGRDMGMPDLGARKIIEESSLTPPQFETCGSMAKIISEPDPMMIDVGETPGGKLPGTTGGGHTDSIASQVSSADGALSVGRTGTNSVSEPDPMTIDGGEAPGGKPPGTTGGAHTDSIASQISNADRALSDGRTGIATPSVGSEANPEAMHGLDSVNEWKAEPESRWLQEAECDLFRDFETYPDSSTRSESESEDDSETRACNAALPIFHEWDWFFRDRKTWETKDDDGLFFRMEITDVVKHCLETSELPAAQCIWEWKTNRNQQYWYCFTCEERFPDQTAHMVHMESKHQLGISCDCYCLVPSQVWQGDLSVANGDVMERTHTLDDSIGVDHTQRAFLIDTGKIEISFQNEEEQLSVQRRSLFARKVGAIQDQLSSLGFLFSTKRKLFAASDVVCSRIAFYFAHPTLPP